MKIHGIIPAMATPMHADGSAAPELVKPLVDKLIERGADGIFAIGSMGEAASLSCEERLQVIRAAVKAADDRVPVLAGTGFVTTEETIRMTKMCRDEGIAAFSVITPFYWKLSQEAIYRHYASVIEATETPVFVYNLPKNTGNNVEPETVGKLYREAGLKGAKDSSAVWENTKGYLDQVGDDFTMLIGEDALCLKGLQYGAAGAISAPSNTYTRVITSIYDRFIAGDMAGAEEAQQDWNEIIRIMGLIGTFPQNFKRITNAVTCTVGPARLPVPPADESRVQEVLEKAGKIAEKYR